MKNRNVAFLYFVEVLMVAVMIGVGARVAIMQSSSTKWTLIAGVAILWIIGAIVFQKIESIIEIKKFGKAHGIKNYDEATADYNEILSRLAWAPEGTSFVEEEWRFFAEIEKAKKDS